ncbi:MAG: polysaccharide biosynthesis C-terminal domain-containing protein [Odoribacteraceae bacterium]|jgi:O-antigen/teichoic acid export membrane protein|nr:polysaccharide biosynthesis C-terminal domain-containing protein [Odoribacteraceae bacterium]
MGIIIRQSIKSTLVNYAGTFIGFLTTMVIATRWLTGEEIGLTRILFEAATLVACLAQLGITTSAVRFFPRFKHGEPRHGGFFTYLLLIPAAGALVVVPLFLLFEGEIAGYFRARSSLFVDYIDWVIPLALFLVYTGVFEIYANLLMRIVIPRFIREVVTRVLIVAVYLLYGTGVLDLTGFVAGYVLVYGVTLALHYWYVTCISPPATRRERPRAPAATRAEFTRYTLVLVLGVTGNAVAARLDLFMVSGMIGLASGGVYTIAFFMAAIIELPSRSITAISTPVVADTLQAGDFTRANLLYKKVALHQLVAGGFIFLLLWANIDNVYDVIPNGDDFRAGKWVVFYIGLSRLVVLFLGFGYPLLSFSRYYHWTLYLTPFVSAVTLGANYLLIPRLGITGSAIATLLAVAITYAVQQWLVFTKLKGNPYSLAIVKALALFAALFALDALLPAVANPWADAAYRTAILCVAGGVALYLLHLSDELDALAKRLYTFFTGKQNA